MAPFLLMQKIGLGAAFAASAGLLYVPFSERTLIRMAYMKRQVQSSVRESDLIRPTRGNPSHLDAKLYTLRFDFSTIILPQACFQQANRRGSLTMAILRGFISIPVIVVMFVATSLLPLASAQQPVSGPQSKPEPALDVTSMDRSVDPCVGFL